MSRQRLVAVLKTLGGLVLLAWLLSIVEPRRLAAALARGEAATTILGLVLLLSAVAFQAVRLAVVGHSFRLGLRESWRITFASYLFNQLLPGGVGGEGYRALHLRRLTERWGSAIGLVTADRAFGAAALLVPGFSYVAVEHRRLAGLLAERGLRVTAPGVGLWALAVVALVAGAATVWLLWLRSERHGVVLRASLRSIRAAVVGIGWWRSAAALALSAAYHGLRLVAFQRLLAALGVRVSAGDLLFVLAVTLAMSMLPLTLGALGIKEGAIVFGLGLFGVGADEALIVALLNRLVLIVLALIGGLFLLWSRTDRVRRETRCAARSRSASPGDS